MLLLQLILLIYVSRRLTDILVINWCKFYYLLIHPCYLLVVIYYLLTLCIYYLVYLFTTRRTYL